MSLLEKESRPINPKSLAFKETIETFGISPHEIARISGVPFDTIKKFMDGRENLTTRIMSRVLLALSPRESAFYGALVNYQTIVQAANIQPQSIKWRDIVDVTDIYRRSFEMTIESFKLTYTDFAAKIGIGKGNLSNWKNGNRDFQQQSLRAVEEGFNFEQRMFFLTLVDIFLILGSDKLRSVRMSA